MATFFFVLVLLHLVGGFGYAMYKINSGGKSAHK